MRERDNAHQREPAASRRRRTQREDTDMTASPRPLYPAVDRTRRWISDRSTALLRTCRGGLADSKAPSPCLFGPLLVDLDVSPGESPAGDVSAVGLDLERVLRSRFAKIIYVDPVGGHDSVHRRLTEQGGVGRGDDQRV